LRAARKSRLVGSLSLLGLIIFSMLIVIVLDSSSLATPALPFRGGPPSGNPGPTGTLAVRLLSNQNQSEMFANPSPSPAPIGRPFPVAGRSMKVSQAANSSNPFSAVLVTDSRGYASLELAPGQYAVSLSDESLDVIIPVEVTAGNQTTLTVDIRGTAYPLIFSEESGVRPAAGGLKSDVYAEVRASTAVANVSEPVILEVHGTAPGSGYRVNATVISRHLGALGTEWLELGAAGSVDPVNATSIVLTTWTYSAFMTVQSTGSLVSFGL
jgi:hypothetical protein